MRRLNSNSSKTVSQPPTRPNVGGLGVASSSDRKRRASTSSLSSVSSISGIEDLSDDAANESDEEDADDEEDDQPAVSAPSYGRRRNQGRKTGRKSTTKRRRVSLSEDEGYEGQKSSDGSDADDSSDDVYAAVDYITDDDDEDRDVEKVEELMILESEDEHRLGSILSTSDVADATAWAGPGVFGEQMILADASLFDEEQIYTTLEALGEAALTSEAAIETPVPRRVHFEQDSDSSSDSDSNSDDDIPSDFLQQDSLDPQLRRMIDNDHEASNRGHRRRSEDIYADSDYGHANIYHVESDAVSEEESSGYESMPQLARVPFSR